MDDARIRKIVQDELKRAGDSERFGYQLVKNHKHNGSDSVRVNSTDINRNPAVLGQVDFATLGATYTFRLNLPQTPRFCFLNGTFVNSTTAPTVRYHIVGTAYLGPAYYLQPVDNRTVAVGGIPYPAPDTLEDGTGATIPAQNSNFFGFINGSSGATAGNSEFHIAYVFGSASLRVTVTDFSKDKITFKVTSLSSGYTLQGNFTII